MYIGDNMCHNFASDVLHDWIPGITSWIHAIHIGNVYRSICHMQRYIFHWWNSEVFLKLMTLFWWCINENWFSRSNNTDNLLHQSRGNSFVVRINRFYVNESKILLCCSITHDLPTRESYDCWYTSSEMQFQNSSPWYSTYLKVILSYLLKIHLSIWPYIDYFSIDKGRRVSIDVYIVYDMAISRNCEYFNTVIYKAFGWIFSFKGDVWGAQSNCSMILGSCDTSIKHRCTNAQTSIIRVCDIQPDEERTVCLSCQQNETWNRRNGQLLESEPHSLFGHISYTADTNI